MHALPGFSLLNQCFFIYKNNTSLTYKLAKLIHTITIIKAILTAALMPCI